MTSGTVVPVDEWRSTNSILSGVSTPAGVTVTADNAMTVTSVFAAIRILAFTAASLPLIIYQGDESGKQRARNHPLYSILHDIPNDEMSSFDLWNTLIGHVLMRGNAYAQIDYDDKGQITALWPLHPDRMTVYRDAINDQLLYIYALPATFNNQTVFLTPDRVLHLRGLSKNGLNGYSVIAAMRNAVGLSKATEEFGSRLFSNDARPGVVLKHPKTLDDPAFQRLQNSWADSHGGLENSHKPAILEEGMDISTLGFNPDDAQFLETRKFQLEEICRMIGVPPHLIFALDHATFSNIEQQSLEFVIYHLRPWLVSIEKQILRSLFLDRERKAGYFAEFLVDGLLRGDLSSRYAAYATAHQNGWLSVNDIRRAENQNPVKGGDLYMVPLNMSVIDPTTGVPFPQPKITEHPTQSPPDNAPNPSTPRREIPMPILKDAVARIERRESHDLETAEKRYSAKRPEKMIAWMEQFYKRDHPEFMKLIFKPFIDAGYFDEERVQQVITEYCDLRGQTLTDDAIQIIEKIDLIEMLKEPE